MSYLLGTPAHRGYVYPDLDSALGKFVAAGIGPFFVIPEVPVTCHYEGAWMPFKAPVAFAHSGESWMEVIAPAEGEAISAYFDAFLRRHPGGGLHHIAWYSADFAATFAMMEAAGKPLRIVVDIRRPVSGTQVEVYCEPVGIEDPVTIQLMVPGISDAWFAAIREAAGSWDGSDPVRDGLPLLMATAGIGVR